MRTLTLTAALAFSTAPAVGEPEPTRGPGDLAVRCGTLYITPTRVVKDGWLVIRDGRVASISTNAPTDQDLTIVDASDKTVMAGLVAADSDLSGHGDDNYNVTPDFVAPDGFDLSSSFCEATADWPGAATTMTSCTAQVPQTMLATIVSLVCPMAPTTDTNWSDNEGVT